MGGMEFTWRMVTTLVWPLVVIVGLIAYKDWITEKLSNVTVKIGAAEFALGTKVTETGKDIAEVIADMPKPREGGAIPVSLVDLLPEVKRSRAKGIRAAFAVVRQALDQAYPELSAVSTPELERAMNDLVAKGRMDPDVAWSVVQLQQLLEMPEWRSDAVGDTRAYAFLMLAEGAIHGILRSAPAHAEGAGSDRIPSLWRGTYDGRFGIELRVQSWNGAEFTGEMAYPGPKTTVTSVSGHLEDQPREGDVRLEWKEDRILHQGSRVVETGGTYRASVSGKANIMRGSWFNSLGNPVAPFEMTASP